MAARPCLNGGGLAFFQACEGRDSPAAFLLGLRPEQPSDRHNHGPNGKELGPDRIMLAMWLKRLFGRGENVSPSGHAPSRKETEQDREDRLEDFMDEQVRQRDEDESRMQDEGGS